MHCHKGSSTLLTRAQEPFAGAQGKAQGWWVEPVSFPSAANIPSSQVTRCSCPHPSVLARAQSLPLSAAPVWTLDPGVNLSVSNLTSCGHDRDYLSPSYVPEAPSLPARLQEQSWSRLGFQSPVPSASFLGTNPKAQPLAQLGSSRPALSLSVASGGELSVLPWELKDADDSPCAGPSPAQAEATSPRAPSAAFGSHSHTPRPS